MTPDEIREHPSTLDAQKWEVERGFREREIAVKEREQTLRETELDLRRKDQASSGWRSPLVVAIFAAAIGAAGNAAVTFVSGVQQRALEAQRSEQAMLLETIRTGNPDTAAENLRFVVEAGLVTRPSLVASVRAFLGKARQPGSGPALPAQIAPTGLSRRTLTAAERAAVQRAYLALHDGLSGARQLLAQLQHANPRDPRRLDSRALELEVALATLQAGNRAFGVDYSGARPPSEEVLQRLEALKKKVQDARELDETRSLGLAEDLIAAQRTIRLFES